MQAKEQKDNKNSTTKHRNNSTATETDGQQGRTRL